MPGFPWWTAEEARPAHEINSAVRASVLGNERTRGSHPDEVSQLEIQLDGLDVVAAATSHSDDSDEN